MPLSTEHDACVRCIIVLSDVELYSGRDTGWEYELRAYSEDEY